MSDENMKEDFFLDILDKQYEESNNKQELDFWFSISKVILESIEIRDLNKISQSDLAQKMKTRQSVISRFENMGRLPNYDFLSRLSIALGHKLGMTLYGDFMAVVPADKQNLIKTMAKKEQVATDKYVQNLLEESINRARLNNLSSLNILNTAPNEYESPGKMSPYSSSSSNFTENKYGLLIAS